jgi:hypothetical protein
MDAPQSPHQVDCGLVQLCNSFSPQHCTCSSVFIRPRHLYISSLRYPQEAPLVCLMAPFMIPLFYFTKTLAVLGPYLGLSLQEKVDEFQLNRSWGQYSPYFDAAEYLELPSGCAVSQVRIHVRKPPTRWLTVH